MLAAALALTTAGCFWQYPRDLPLVETNARYWRGEFELAAGERIEVVGRFPHARQMSFNLHRRSDNAALAGLPDEAITPRAGATNPFRRGARRDGRARSYRFTIGPDRAALRAAPNDGSGGRYRLLYRYYLPDAAHPGGGVPLPTVVRIDAHGRRSDLGSDCPDPAGVDPAQPTGPTRIPPAPGEVADPLDWRGSATPAGSGTGDLLVNRDNAYAYALTDMRRGEVLVLRGRAPTAPRTYRGARQMGAGQVRYWSICAYRHPSDRAAACLADEFIPLDRNGRYTIVVSPAHRRPPNARYECGIAWLDSLGPGAGVLLLRHVRPDARFLYSPLQIPAGQAVRGALGDYEPYGTYADGGEVSQLQCRSGRANTARPPRPVSR